VQDITEQDFQYFNETVEKLFSEDLSDLDIKQIMDNADKTSKIATSLLEYTLADMDLSAGYVEEVMSQISILCKLENLAGNAQMMQIFEMIPFERDMGNPIN
jgi:predicted unusual protein kinase regulating ubiquinone biosynthesis (AarF/ABC1/UbiB family)